MRLTQISLAAAALFALPSYAQQLELPRPSPTAKVSQVVGLTEVNLEYSSPGVHGRKIFGGLIPEGKLWRTGANAATKITFSKDVEIGGTKVPAGTYSIFTIPGEPWTIIVNKVWQQGGVDQYKQAEDAVRVQAKPEKIEHRERLTFLFAHTSDTQTRLDLEWENTRVGLPIRAYTDEQVTASIANLEKNQWRPFNNAARWLMEGKKDYEGGLKLAERSIALHEDWLNLFTKAQCLAGLGKYREAVTLAERAQELGNQAPKGQFFFADEIKKAIGEWKDKG
jgi:tetratricopeptide (TPR) repeat protein